MRLLPGVRIYSCIDSLEDLPHVDPARMRRREAELLAAVDAVAACSKPLVEQLEGRAPNLRYIPHGCDPGFVLDHPREGPVPDPLRSRPRPFVGYVGSMNFRLDADLLDGSRQATDGGTLVLVGGLASSAGPAPSREVAALVARSDVVAVGHREPPELVSYLAALDAGIAPYALTPFNRKSYPIKIPQYLGAGLAVVSTPNGATDELAPFVSVASSRDTFEAAVRRACADHSGRDQRVAIAKARPWTSVAKELLDLAGASGRADQPAS
jgi:glycosyltransferase involved in cell wall biosynthesis